MEPWEIQQPPVRMDLGVMAKKYATFCRAPKLGPHHQTPFSVIRRHLFLAKGNVALLQSLQSAYSKLRWQNRIKSDSYDEFLTRYSLSLLLCKEMVDVDLAARKENSGCITVIDHFVSPHHIIYIYSFAASYIFLLWYDWFLCCCFVLLLRDIISLLGFPFFFF